MDTSVCRNHYTHTVYTQQIISTQIGTDMLLLKTSLQRDHEFVTLTKLS